MPRRPRKISGSGIYHVMIRGINKMQIFNDDADNIQFLHFLEYTQTDDFQILAYCLMGNHAHLLIRTSKNSIEALETGMKSLCIRYAAYYNRKYERIGTLFQDRYKSQPVTTVGYFLRVLRYIHNNPVAAGITDTMADYPWSSYRDYFATRSTCICKVHTGYALQVKIQDELLQWHTKTEINTRGRLDVDSSKSKISDAEINHIITALTGMPAAQLQQLPEEKQAKVLQRLIDDENIGFAQLARLTGIEKGRIKRLIL